MDVTLAAFYGPKPLPLAALIVEAQRELRRLLGYEFEPYRLHQVHATIVGLEGAWIDGGPVNANFRRAHGRHVSMSLRRVLQIARVALPLTVRIGGYRRETDYRFASRGLHPYQRSFSIQGEIAVVLGWPFDGGDYSPRLGRLRRRFEEAGVLHKYHVSGGAPDNDLFLVLGRVAGHADREAMPEVAEDALREWLASRDPLELALTVERLALVAYSDPRLPPGTSRAFALDEAENRIEQIEALYRGDPEDS